MLSARQEKAIEYFKKGYNCAQSVAVAFAKDMDISEVSALKMSSAFGGGFARSRELCGAVSAMGLVAGVLKYDDGAESSKKDIYEFVNKLSGKFKAEFQAVNCGQLLKDVSVQNSGLTPDERNEKYYGCRPCVGFVTKAVEILEEGLF